MTARRKWEIVGPDGEPRAVIEAGGRRQALLAYARAIGRGLLQHSGAYQPVLLGAEDAALRAEPYRGDV